MGVIPDMVHPLSKHWDQPERDDIAIDDTHAFMNKDSFDQLKEYSMSTPAGAYEGKMWKCNSCDKWFLVWFDVCEDSTNLRTHNREIIIVGER